MVHRRAFESRRSAWPLCLALAGLLTASAVGQIEPALFLNYYGFPSQVNGASTNAEAAAVFADFDVVIFGDGLQSLGHADHANTAAIITAIQASGTGVYGYVNLGALGESTAVINAEIDDWNTNLGVDGMFLDEFGYDFGVDRARQNAVVDHVHGLGLSAFANGYIPADVLGSAVDATFNPAGTATSLGDAAGDGYMLENLTVADGVLNSHSLWAWRAQEALRLTATATNPGISNNVDVFMVNTSAISLPNFQDLVDHGHRATVIHGFPFFSHTNVQFSASGPSQDQVFSLTLPTGFGTSFTSSIGPLNGRVERVTDTGMIEVHGTEGDSSSYGSSFTPSGSLTVANGYPITVDGASAEWAPVPVLIHDPSEGADPGKADFERITITNDATDLFFRVESFSPFTPDVNFNIYMDTDEDQTTGYTTGVLGADHLIQGTTLYEFTGVTQSTWSWNSLGSLSSSGGPTTDLEIAVDRSDIGMGAPGAAMHLRLLNDSGAGDAAPDWGAGGIYTYHTATNIVPVELAIFAAD
jgi:hypothetical protein